MKRIWQAFRSLKIWQIARDFLWGLAFLETYKEIQKEKREVGNPTSTTGAAACSPSATSQATSQTSTNPGVGFRRSCDVSPGVFQRP